MATPHGPMPAKYPHTSRQTHVPTYPQPGHAGYYPPVGHPAIYHQPAPAVVYHAPAHQGYRPPNLPGGPQLPHLFQRNSQSTTPGVTQAKPYVKGYSQVNPSANSPTAHPTDHYDPTRSSGSASGVPPSQSGNFSSAVYPIQVKSQSPTPGSISNPYNGYPQENHPTHSSLQSSTYHHQAPSKGTASTAASHSGMNPSPHASLSASHYLGNSTDQRQLPLSIIQGRGWLLKHIHLANNVGLKKTMSKTLTVSDREAGNHGYRNTIRGTRLLCVAGKGVVCKSDEVGWKR